MHQQKSNPGLTAWVPTLLATELSKAGIKVDNSHKTPKSPWTKEPKGLKKSGYIVFELPNIMGSKVAENKCFVCDNL